MRISCVPRAALTAAALVTLGAAPAAAIGLPLPLPGPVAGHVAVPPAGGNRLTVTYDRGDGQARTYTLRCGAGPGGMRAQATPQEPLGERGGQDGQDGVDAGAACSRLAELGGPVGPVAAGQMCSMIYGGPQTARVTGVWDGARVSEEYRRTDGCEVARWGRMVPALPSPAVTPTTASAPHALDVQIAPTAAPDAARDGGAPDAAPPGPAA
jgi:hypothetical protein